MPRVFSLLLVLFFTSGARADRAAKCRAHIQESLQSIALQLVVTNDDRTPKSVNEGRSCVFAGEKAVRSCLTKSERAALKGLIEQRQRDCKAWSPQLARCVLDSPNANGCDDGAPFWRAPLPLGGAGPRVVWSRSTELGEQPDFLSVGARHVEVAVDDMIWRMGRKKKTVRDAPESLDDEDVPLTFTQAENNPILDIRVISKTYMAVRDRMGVALLSIPACKRLGAQIHLPTAAFVSARLGYKVGSRPKRCPTCVPVARPCLVHWQTDMEANALAPIAPDGVAFNTALIESRHTHFLSSKARWKAHTGGIGRPAGDRRHVYVVARDFDGQTRLLALNRKTGKARWNTLLSPTDPGDEAAVIVQGRWLAAWAAERLYVVRLR
jgi:hypothetical protein